MGINSVRRYKISSGRISGRQIKTTEKILNGLDPKLIKIVVCHHPFEMPYKSKTIKKYTHSVVSHSKTAMKHFSRINVDIFLSGHIHQSHVSDTKKRYKIDGYSGLIVQAGTAMSKRTRWEPVAFNVLKIKRPVVSIENYVGDKLSPEYALVSTKKFQKNEDGWRIV